MALFIVPNFQLHLIIHSTYSYRPVQILWVCNGYRLLRLTLAFCRSTDGAFWQLIALFAAPGAIRLRWYSPLSIITWPITSIGCLLNNLVSVLSYVGWSETLGIFCWWGWRSQAHLDKTINFRMALQKFILAETNSFGKQNKISAAWWVKTLVGFQICTPLGMQTWLKPHYHASLKHGSQFLLHVSKALKWSEERLQSLFVGIVTTDIAQGWIQESWKRGDGKRVL